MDTAPKLEHFRDVDLHCMLLHLRGERYILDAIYFKRESSILEKSIEIELSGYELTRSPEFLLPYSERRVLVRRKAKFDGKPYVLRQRSGIKGFRKGCLILPFHDFKFKKEQRFDIIGHERTTYHYYKSHVDRRLELMIDSNSEPVPRLVEQAKEALLAYMHKERAFRTAQMAYNEAEKDYLRLDPSRTFLRQHKEVTGKIGGGA